LRRLVITASFAFGSLVRPTPLRLNMHSISPPFDILQWIDPQCRNRLRASETLLSSTTFSYEYVMSQIRVVCKHSVETPSHVFTQLRSAFHSRKTQKRSYHSNQMDMFTDDIAQRDWCRDNTSGLWCDLSVVGTKPVSIFSNTFMFERGDDAMLFKLVWGSP
jgi:hypothetical protein